MSVRVLGPGDVPAALGVIRRDPVANVFVDYRTRITQLDRRWLGGEMWGFYEDDELVSMCHVGANMVPVNASSAACEAFVEQALRGPSRGVTRCSTIVGPQDAVEALWAGLEGHWPHPRDFRWDQPHLVATRPPTWRPDPAVRRTRKDQLEALYPACVAMYTEEVGISPEIDGGRDLYRARVSQLVSRGWSFSRIEDGRVLFKAEVACSTPFACQIQGVYVDPELRGQGLASAGMATVVEICLREIAPAVSLYVNAHNVAARHAYERVGFEQTGTFSTIMF
jgi:predicted GNAT family acetyltransferase